MPAQYLSFKLRELAATVSVAFVFVVGCSDDSLSSSTTSGTAGSGGTSSSSTTGAGATGGTSSTSGGAGGTGGQGGATSSSAGGTTSTGTGGSTGARMLVVAGGIPDSLATAAVWNPGPGWGTSTLNLQFKKAALAWTGNSALAVFRRLSNNPPMGDDELYYGEWTPAGFGALTSMGSVAIDGPALAPHGVATMLTVLAPFNQHSFLQYEAGMFGPSAAIPAGLPGTTAFGPSASTLVPFGIAGVYTAYSGADEKTYMCVKTGPGSIWSPSQMVPSSAVVNTLAPSMVVNTDDDLEIFYIRKSDGHICTVKLITPQNGWELESDIHPNAISGNAPAAVGLPGGDALVAWRGFDTQGIYFSRRTAGVWSDPVTVDVPALPSSPPVVLTGLDGADAEILYTAGAKLQWARVTGTSVTPGEDPKVTNVTSIAGLIVPGL